MGDLARLEHRRRGRLEYRIRTKVIKGVGVCILLLVAIGVGQTVARWTGEMKQLQAATKQLAEEEARARVERRRLEVEKSILATSSGQVIEARQLGYGLPEERRLILPEDKGDGPPADAGQQQ